MDETLPPEDGLIGAAPEWFEKSLGFVRDSWTDFLNEGNSEILAYIIPGLVTFVVAWVTLRQISKSVFRNRFGFMTAIAVALLTAWGTSDFLHAKFFAPQLAEQEDVDKLRTEMADLKTELATYIASVRNEAAIRGEVIDENVWAQTETAALDLAAKSPQAEAAIRQVLAGNESGFDALFTDADKASGEVADYWIEIGDIAFMNYTDRALEAYRKAAMLDDSRAHAWNRIGLLEKRRGKLDEAEAAFKQVLDTAGADDMTWRATALANLGLITMARGQLSQSEDYLLRALILLEGRDQKQRLAAVLGNLGLVAKAQGDLDKAETYHNQALEIANELDDRKSIAAQFGNLGLISRARGDLEAAEDYLTRSLAIETELDHKEGMAADLGNLGNIAQARGNLDKAENYHDRSLAILTELDHKEGMAVQLGNLGIVTEARGDVTKACQYWGKALTLFREIGMNPQIEMTEGIMIDAKCIS